MDIQDQILLSMTQGFFNMHLLHSAAGAGIFDALYDRQLSLEELERRLEIKPDLVARLVRPLAAMGLIGEEHGLLKLTELGARLSRRSSGSLADFLQFNAREAAVYWSKMDEALQKKTYPYLLVERQGFFSAQSADRDKYEAFNGMMRGSSRRLKLDKCFSPQEQGPEAIVDVGGGAGDIIGGLLHHFPRARGIVYDLEHVRRECRDNLQGMGVGERCSFVPGSFFESVPVGGDLYILSRILHDWEDEDCLRILRNIAASMSGESQLLVIEKLLPPEIDRKHLHLYMNDLYMWALCGGKERTEAELARLFTEAGLLLKKVCAISEEEYALTVMKDARTEGAL